LIVTIMNVKFVDRKEELSLLERLCGEGKPHLVLVYGRRRVGKTRLLLELLSRRPGLYFYVPLGGRDTVLAELSRAVEGEFFRGFRFPDFSSFLEYIAVKLERGVTVVVDEFQRLAEVEGAISLLQRYWDERFSKSRGVLILSGSTVGVIERVALRGDAPLYGRRTAVLKLEPLGFRALTEWFTGYSPLELVKIYGAFGGTPAYLELVDEGKSPERNIIDLVLSKRGPLHEEPLFLLLEELRAPARYMDVLTAISQGRRTLSEIASAAGISRENLTTYLATLEHLGLIERERPVLSRGRSMYSIKDPFFAFWFRFVWPNKSLLERGLENELWASVAVDFNTYLGWVFEKVALEHVVSEVRSGRFPLEPDVVGRWWAKGEEVDIVVASAREGVGALIEVKWSDLSHHEARAILRRLSEKGGQIQLREKLYGLVARSLEGKEELRRMGYLVYDLSDIAG